MNQETCPSWEQARFRRTIRWVRFFPLRQTVEPAVFLSKGCRQKRLMTNLTINNKIIKIIKKQKKIYLQFTMLIQLKNLEQSKLENLEN